MEKENLNKKRGQRLKECRIEKHLTQKQLAELCFCTTQTISYIENGKRGMSRDLAHTFATHLEVDEKYLLCEEFFKTFHDKFKYLEDLSNECDARLTNLLHLLGHTIKFSFNAGELKDPESLIGKDARIHFDTCDNSFLLKTSNTSKRVHDVSVQFDDITISLITFTEFLNDIYNYIDFLIEHLANKEEQNALKMSLADIESAIKKDIEFDSLSPKKKIEYLKKQFGEDAIYIEDDHPYLK